MDHKDFDYIFEFCTNYIRRIRIHLDTDHSFMIRALDFNLYSVCLDSEVLDFECRALSERTPFICKIKWQSYEHLAFRISLWCYIIYQSVKSSPLTHSKFDFVFVCSMWYMWLQYSACSGGIQNQTTYKFLLIDICLLDFDLVVISKCINATEASPIHDNYNGDQQSTLNIIRKK